MSFKNKFPMLAMVLLCLLAPADVRGAGPVPVDSEKAAHEVRAVLEGWTKDFNDRNLERVCNIFAPDLISNYGDSAENSYDSLCNQLKASLSNPALKLHYSLDLNEIIVSGDIAIVRLIWTLTVKDTDDKVVEVAKDRGMDMFRLQPDGTWKISRFLAYPMAGEIN